ncbi:MAG: hypothetical protein L0J77_11345 [Marinobacter sp.]|nr:hypothetical protein [Marinobacter sp.]
MSIHSENNVQLSRPPDLFKPTLPTTAHESLVLAGQIALAMAALGYETRIDK